VSIEEIVAHNSHELTAHLLITERSERAAERERHYAEQARLRATMEQAHIIGLRVLVMREVGRKSARLDALVEGTS